MALASSKVAGEVFIFLHHSSQYGGRRMEDGGRRGDGLPIQLRDLLCDDKVLVFTEEGLCGIRLASLEDITIPR
jgi:hypothetical protein